MRTIKQTIQGDEETWIEFKRTGSKPLRDKLILRYESVVEHTARAIHSRLPTEVDVDDLISEGNFGLFDAIDAFDLNRGVKFETYCSQRIRGAIMDYLRKIDWIPRLTRSRYKRIEKARGQLTAQLGRAPTDEEIMSKLKLTRDQFEKILNDSKTVALTSLSRKTFENDRGVQTMADGIADDVESPELDSRRQELQKLITEGLSRKHRLIIILYHFEGYNMKEIGEMLYISESRVSQMHDSAILQIKSKLHLMKLVA